MTMAKEKTGIARCLQLLRGDMKAMSLTLREIATLDRMTRKRLSLVDRLMSSGSAEKAPRKRTSKKAD